MIYCTGTITNNGTISMTARGARAEGENVYLYENNNNTFEYIPAQGAKGGESLRKGRNSGGNGINGYAGSKRQTGGGGSGGGAISYGTSKDAGAGSSEGGTGGYGLAKNGVARRRSWKSRRSRFFFKWKWTKWNWWITYNK